MKKLVNGKVVDVDNIQLFKLAAEGLALQSTAVSSTTDGVEANINSPLVRKYIKLYDVFFKSMPYPLYAIENDIKYATLGNFIKSFTKELLEMWVDRGLYIRLDRSTGMTLRIVNNTWSIVYVKGNKSDNTSMNNFESSIGYKEYNWLLNKIINNETTANFYEEFMPNFVKACNNEPMILKWELENMLTFGIIPNRIDLKQNKIINIQENKEYILDIYCTGTMNTDEKMQSWSLTDRPGSLGVKYKQMKTYGFDAYVKSISDSVTDSKLEKCKMTGLHNLFMQLCGLKGALDLNQFPNFEGIISDTNLVFTIEKRLFIAKANRLSEPIDIAHGVELYNVEKNKVYFIKSKRINEKISEDSLYSYSIPDGILRLCKMGFSY